MYCFAYFGLLIKLTCDNNPDSGGAVGRAVDCTLRTESFRTTMAKRNKKLQEHGFYLPSLVDSNINKRGIPVLTQSYLAETLLRASERQRRRAQAEHWPKCKNGGIPPWVLQPNVGKWFRPLYLNDNSVDGENDLLEFEESEMRDFMMSHFPSLPDNDTVIWGLCAVYWYGGAFVTHDVQDLRSVSSILEVGNDRACMDTAVIHFEGNDHLRVLKATPRHPLLACAIQKLQSVDSPGTVNPSIFADGWNFDEPTWFEGNCQPADTTVECCDTTKADRVKGTLNIQVTAIGDVVVADMLKGKGGPRVDVSIMEASHAVRGAKVAKQSLADHLTGLGCNAGWICNRCLKTEWFGSYRTCSAVCPPCYEKVICHDPHGPVRSEVVVDVLVQERRPLDRNPHHNNKYSSEYRIPRIIHQTYFEELTPDRYPHLYRLQNSWRASGWDYRFYSDAMAREYIIKNFPSFFIEAFDALNPGAFKVCKLGYFIESWQFAIVAVLF
jgi:hypothetical protein